MMNKHMININTQECIGCEQCVKDCPADNLIVSDNKAILKSQQCIKCGHCVAICPKGAVLMTGFDEEPIAFEEQPRLDPQQLQIALQARRSIRQFTKEPVTQDLINMIIEAGRWTPTAKNAQSVSFLVLQKEKDNAEALAVRFFKRLMPLVQMIYPAAKGIKIKDTFFFKGAPLVISIVSKDKISGSLAGANMALMAESQGLGVLYSGFFSMAVNMSSSLRRALGLNRKEKIVTTLVLGYSGVTYHRTTQKEKAIVKEI